MTNRLRGACDRGWRPAPGSRQLAVSASHNLPQQKKSHVYLLWQVKPQSQQILAASCQDKRHGDLPG